MKNITWKQTGMIAITLIGLAGVVPASYSMESCGTKLVVNCMKHSVWVAGKETVTKVCHVKGTQEQCLQ